MKNIMKYTTQLMIVTGLITSLYGCGSQTEEVDTTKNMPEEPVIAVEPEEDTVDFTVDLEGSYWQMYYYEFENEAGNMSQDGRGLDEWSQTISFNEDGTASWLELDFTDDYKTTGALYGTYEVVGNQIVVTSYEDSSYSTVDTLTFEMMDDNILRLEYPEKNYSYYEYVDLEYWANQYMSYDRLEDTYWIAVTQQECFEECEVTAVDQNTHEEIVSFYSDGTAHWMIFNYEISEMADEIVGYWKIDGELIVVSRYENEEDNGHFDQVYFSYADGMLHRNAGGAIDYALEYAGSLSSDFIADYDMLNNSSWVLLFQEYVNYDSGETSTKLYPDENHTVVTLDLEGDGKGIYTCRNEETSEIYYSVEWDWYLEGNEIVLQLPEGDENPYDLMSPIRFLVEYDCLSHQEMSVDGSFSNTDVYIMQARG